jgi:hypothetical protein
VEELRREMREKERKWEEERRGLKCEIGELEGRVKDLERKEKEMGGDREEKKGEEEEVERRVRRLERSMEMRERERRRRSLIFREVEVRDGKRKEAMQDIMERIGVRVGLEEVAKGKDDREVIAVRVESEEQRREVLENRRKLRGEREKVMEDWTWKERKMRWKLEEIAREEEWKGRGTWLGYGSIRIDGQWWKWDEEEEVLRDGRGNIRRRETGERKGKGGRD